MRTLKNKKFRLANCSDFLPTEKLVQNGLALRPRDIKILSDKGIPVNLRNAGHVKDLDNAGTLPLYAKRGTDINIAWETSMKTKQDIIKSYRINRANV